MSKHTCSVCSYEYDYTEGIPEQNIEKGTPFEDLPMDFNCPICSSGKIMFEIIADEHISDKTKTESNEE